MRRKDEEYLLSLTEDNNRMLREIVKYINYVNANADNENNNDFVRNVIANLISSSIPRLSRVR